MKRMMKKTSRQLPESTHPPSATLDSLVISDFKTVLPAFLVLFLPSLVVVSLIAYGLILHDQADRQQLWKASILNTVELAVTDIELTFRSIISDLRYLTKSNAVRRLVDDEINARATLASDLYFFAREKGLYDQVRFLDTDGMERVRINYNAGSPTIVPVAALQNKKGRYYFDDTLRLSRNEVFVSPLDLNIERGKIERPLKPMIRFGMPVFGSDGQKKGIVLLNFLSETLLTDFNRVAMNSNGTLSLLNRDGYWLSGPDPRKEWGFMFPERKELTFGNRFPDAWHEIQANRSGLFHGEMGQFVYTTVYPITPDLSSSSGAGEAYTPSSEQLRSREYLWKVVALHPAYPLMDAIRSPIIWGLYTLALLGIAVGTWFRARSLCQVQLTFKQLERVRVELEQQVAERTRELRESHEQLELLLASTGEGLYGIDIQGRCTFANRASLEILGYRDEALLLGKNMHELAHHSHADGSPYDEAMCPIFEAFRQGEYVHRDDEVLWRADGSAFAAEYRSHSIVRDGAVVGAVVTFNDITERKQTEEQIRTLSQALEQSPVSVVITDHDGNIEYVNSTFERVTGYRSAEVIGQNPRLLNTGTTSKAHYQELWQTISSGKAWQGEFQNRKKNGQIFWEHAHIAPVLDESGVIRHFLAVKEDITLRKQQDEHILHQAHFDTLTDLPNRFLALDRLSQLIIEAGRNKERVAVLFLDLDDFKKINDTLGHEAGDNLLIEAAERLSSVVRGGDTVGRLGGDEFIVLLGGLTDAADARPVAENLLIRFREAFCIGGRELVLTASIGIAVYPDDGDSPSELLRNVDSAMYHSKEQGRNTYSYFTDAMNRGVSRRLFLEEQMHGALNRCEFRLCYQPQIDISSGRIIGVEVLLRWHNPALGEVPPVEYIPIAEQTGLIVPIGQFVLTEALGMSARWQQQHEQQFTMAVNLSPRQFRDPNLVAFIEEAIDQSGVTSESLELEITEGVLMSGHAYIDDALASLHKLGVGIAMDDFGTGYSSLSYLRNYPFDTLKIDRDFVNDITVDMANQELVNAAIAMAHGLGLKVVAEGVETKEQLAFLASQGCEIAQGYLFSKPLSQEEMTEMLDRHNWESIIAYPLNLGE